MHAVYPDGRFFPNQLFKPRVPSSPRLRGARFHSCGSDALRIPTGARLLVACLPMKVHGIERGLAFWDGSSVPMSFRLGGILRFTKVFDVSMVAFWSVLEGFASEKHLM